MTSPRIFAHRGASKAAPENTLEAFRIAREQGAYGVELDVRRTSDGVLVLRHDATLDDGALVRDMCHADLPAVIPTLDEALDECAGMVVNVEIKNHPVDPDFDVTLSIADEVAALLERRQGDDVLLSSFHPPTLERFAECSSVPVGLLTMVDPNAVDGIPMAAANGWVAIHPHDHAVDAELVEAAHAAGVAVNVWTVDDPDRIRALARLGVDAIITNVPGDAIAALAG